MRQLILFVLIFCLANALFAQDYSTYEIWKIDYEEAKTEYGTATVLSSAGLIVSITGFIVTVQGERLLGNIIGLGGLGIGLAGFTKARKSKTRLEMLKAIGYKRGYLSASIQPEYKGASISISLSF